MEYDGHGPECCCRTCVPAPAPNWPPTIEVPEDVRHIRGGPETYPDGMYTPNSNPSLPGSTRGVQPMAGGGR